MKMERRPGAEDDADRGASHLYCTIGPLMSSATRVFGAERAAEVKDEWRVWKAEHYEAYLAGDPAAPPPPYADELDHYAR